MSKYDTMLVTLFTLAGSQHTGLELWTYAHMLAFSVYVYVIFYIVALNGILQNSVLLWLYKYKTNVKLCYLLVYP